ncbi:hypothetical protein conserved [Leishmania donovani]|uniref:Uncharacterized protein n=2 Tax=Leishmania donovani TaxID=5661 RepID=A0A504Y8L4_LEIDO|nr:hypothetical protein CGC20_21965 [Leishmania donovani]CAJ1988670.1 hypothetical protein conserved [Leishmania donovani]
MPTPPHSPLHAPPLPRYRYHPKTGVWRKERVPEDGACAGTTTDTTAAIASPASGPTPSEPFESSYDYFLRSLRPPVHRIPAAKREELFRERTNAKLRQFEMHLLPKAATVTKRNMHGLITGDDCSMTKTLEPSAQLHPLVGYASAVSLPTVYSALVKVTGRVLSFAAAGEEDRLSREGFRELLALIGPAEVLSTKYADTMFTSLPSYNADSDTTEALAIFTLLIEHRHHPRLNSNVEALFGAFDTDVKGVVPAEALYPDVLAAWAVQRTYGNLRDQWQRFAAVISMESERSADAFPLLPPLASRTAIRAALCSAAAIYTAACSLDLDGSSL